MGREREAYEVVSARDESGGHQLPSTVSLSFVDHSSLPPA